MQTIVKFDPLPYRLGLKRGNTIAICPNSFANFDNRITTRPKV